MGQVKLSPDRAAAPSGHGKLSSIIGGFITAAATHTPVCIGTARLPVRIRAIRTVKIFARERSLARNQLRVPYLRSSDGLCVAHGRSCGTFVRLPVQPGMFSHWLYARLA